MILALYTVHRAAIQLFPACMHEPVTNLDYLYQEYMNLGRWLQLIEVVTPVCVFMWEDSL